MEEEQMGWRLLRGHVDANPLPLETRTEAQGVIMAWLPQWEGQDHDITALIILSLPEIHAA